MVHTVAQHTSPNEMGESRSEAAAASPPTTHSPTSLQNLRNCEASSSYVVCSACAACVQRASCVSTCVQRDRARRACSVVCMHATHTHAHACLDEISRPPFVVVVPVEA
eukprot:scaffold73265_cov69-Phaeocystis_antarctica.AAC.6